jgi:glycerate 2-kinase
MANSIVKKLRKDAVYLFQSGINSVLPQNLIPKNIFLMTNTLIISGIYGKRKQFKLNDYKRVFVIGAGKASPAMAKEIEKILGDKIFKGLIVTKYNFARDLKKIKIIEAGHPLPDVNGLSGSKKIINICKKADRDDLIINLISGGASSLLPCPAGSITLSEKIKTTQLLIDSGAAIKEINIVRKHISAIKGGKLAKYVYPATMINIIISDVIGDDLETIGSGLTVPDSSTFKDSLEIISKYNLQDNIPDTVNIHLKKGIIAEISKDDSAVFKNTHNFIIGNNKIALSAIMSSAKKMSYHSKIISNILSGNPKEAAKRIINILDDPKLNDTQCFLFGGETEVTLKGKGKGGRNQELCLYASNLIAGKKNVVFFSAGTDGNDGPTEAAGAICDGSTLKRAKSVGLDIRSFLDNNDSFNFFNKLNDLIITGPTGTNVMDIQILLRY